ncbi:hypothetical protein Vc3S01_3105 [Vibrio campbellii]|nr:hypothetical protein Vc3S01_3105 [Vibrio campbellii]EDL68848.1 hypothetical protein A1Q_0415 [Vibrio campbellii HY01]
MLVVVPELYEPLLKYICCNVFVFNDAEDNVEKPGTGQLV